MKQAEIASLLPAVYRRTLAPKTPLAAIMAAIESLHDPVEQTLEGLEAAFDPYRAPDRMIPYLAGWLDLDRMFDEVEGDPISSGLGRVRELISDAAYLSQWRGTAKGLKRFLETATGVGGFSIQDAAARPFHLVITAPPDAAPHQALVRRIVEMEKPAYSTFEIIFGSRR